MQNIKNKKILCHFNSKEDEDLFDLPIYRSWERKVLVTQNESESHSVMSDSAAPWTVACQAPLFVGIPQAKILEWLDISSSRGSSQTRDQTTLSCFAGRFFTV